MARRRLPERVDGLETRVDDLEAALERLEAQDQDADSLFGADGPLGTEPQDDDRQRLQFVRQDGRGRLAPAEAEGGGGRGRPGRREGGGGGLTRALALVGGALAAAPEGASIVGELADVLGVRGAREAGEQTAEDLARISPRRAITETQAALRARNVAQEFGQSGVALPAEALIDLQRHEVERRLRNQAVQRTLRNRGRRVIGTEALRTLSKLGSQDEAESEAAAGGSSSGGVSFDPGGAVGRLQEFAGDVAEEVGDRVTTTFNAVSRWLSDEAVSEPKKANTERLARARRGGAR